MTTTYEFLNEQTLGSYIASHPVLSGYVDGNNIAEVKEIGDGNLNLVFIAKDTNGKSLCIKQALPYVRMVGEGWPMTPDRARHEAMSLIAYGKHTPDLVVRVLDYNPDRYIIAMEDLSDHEVWRGALNEGAIHEGAARELGRYVGSLAFHTSLFALERNELGELEKDAVNPELCEITEDLVFTEPAAGADRNEWLPSNEQDVKDFAADPNVQEMMGLAKYKFMVQREALIHGDLHTGSVMVRKAPDSDHVDSVKAFDSEFSYFGPVGFDIGAVWANFVIAAARAYALGETERATWILRQLQETWEGFETEFLRLWPTRRDQRLWDDQFAAQRIDNWLEDSWLFAAAKMSRRVVGVAKTTDLTTLPDHLAEGANRGVLLVARKLVSRFGEAVLPNDMLEEISEILRMSATAD